jgi:Domain of unknown function (DUF4864)
MRRLITSLGLLLALLAAPAFAQSEQPVPAPAVPEMATPDAATIAEWQTVIHGQLQAFRTYDAATALSFAAASFHATYADPSAFFMAIVAGGYAPIIESQSESFGDYKMIAPDVVYQDVKLAGKGTDFFDAMYRLTKEADGWRVEGVQLIKMPGVGA